MSRSLVGALALLLGALAGCTSIDGATEDSTQLQGEVPVGLGRTLAVEVAGAGSHGLLAALQRELIQQDLFDRVVTRDDAAAPVRLDAQLRVRVVESSTRELYDPFLIESAFVVRYELAIELDDAAGERVLSGQVSGIAADPETPLDFVGPTKREDIRLAALHDAAMKMSWALRKAAGARVKKALASLPRVRLESGVGPVPVAVIGFDDERTARKRRGPALAEHLAESLSHLGPELTVIPQEDVRRLASRLPDRFLEIERHELELITQRVPARFLVVGQVRVSGGQVAVTLRMLDPSGELILTREAEAEGLGALPVVAVKLTRSLAKALEERA